MFTNAVAGQSSCGSARSRASGNGAGQLGARQFELPFEPAPKGQARVGVQFEIDANGILHVLARDTMTGSEQVVEIASAVDVSDEAVERMLEESVEHAFEDVNERVFTEAKLKAEELLPAVRRALAQVGDALRETDRANICSARPRWKPRWRTARRRRSGKRMPPWTKPPSTSPPCSSSRQHANARKDIGTPRPDGAESWHRHPCL